MGSSPTGPTKPMWTNVIKRLQNGETVELRPHGNSMSPRIKSGQLVRLEPITQAPKPGDIVLSKVRGHYYLHLVRLAHDGQYQIANNHGHINGWTSQVFGVVTSVGE